MSGILHARQSGSCCCQSLPVVPCDASAARQELRREDENGVPFWNELSVTVVGGTSGIRTYTCSGWVGANSFSNISNVAFGLRKSISPFPPFTIGFEQTVRASCGAYSYSTGTRYQDLGTANCCPCYGDTPWPPPCPQNCPTNCPEEIGTVVTGIGNPLGGECPERFIQNNICCGSCQGCKIGWYTEIRRVIGGGQIYVSHSSLNMSQWPTSFICGSTVAHGIEWVLEVQLAQDFIDCDGNVIIGGLPGSWFYYKPCCNALEGPAGVYLPRQDALGTWSVPSSGTTVGPCSTSQVTSSLPQGYALVTRIPE